MGRVSLLDLWMLARLIFMLSIRPPTTPVLQAVRVESVGESGYGVTLNLRFK